MAPALAAPLGPPPPRRPPPPTPPPPAQADCGRAREMAGPPRPAGPPPPMPPPAGPPRALARGASVPTAATAQSTQWHSSAFSESAEPHVSRSSPKAMPTSEDPRQRSNQLRPHEDPPLRIPQMHPDDDPRVQHPKAPGHHRHEQPRPVGAPQEDMRHGSGRQRQPEQPRHGGPQSREDQRQQMQQQHSRQSPGSSPKASDQPCSNNAWEKQLGPPRADGPLHRHGPPAIPSADSSQHRDSHSTERRHRMQAETRRNQTVAGDQRLPTPLRLPQDNLLQTDPCLRTSSTPVGRRRNFGHLQRLRGRKVALILGQVVAHGHDCEGKQRQLDRSFQALCSPPKAPLRMPLKDDWQEKVGPQRHHRSSKRRLQLCPRAWNHCPSLRNHQSRQQVLWRHLTQTVLHPMTLTAMRCHQSMRCLT